MRKFKLFMASVLTYFMTMSILPTGLVGIVANAAENEYKALIKSDYYLRSNQQYGNKSLIAYVNEKDGKVIISKVEGGNETVLKEAQGYTSATIYKNSDNTAMIRYYKYVPQSGIESYYEYYDLDKNIFTKTDGNGWTNPEIEAVDLSPIVIKEDTEVKNLIKMIFNESNIDINIDTMQKADNGFFEVAYKDSENQVLANITKFPNKGNVIQYEVGYGKVGSGYKVSEGIIKDNYIYVGKESIDGIPNVEFNYDSISNSIFIYDEIEYKYENNNSSYKYKVSELKDNKVISEGIIESNDINYFSQSFKQNNFLFINSGREIYKYSLSNGIYKLENIINLYSSSVSINKNDDSYWYIENKDGKPWLSKLKNNNVINVAEIKEGIKNYQDSNIIIYDDNNILIRQYNNFIIVQNSNNIAPNVPEEPSNPETPKPQEPSTPVTPTNPGNNDNGATKPSEEKVVIEVTKINPNEKNEIPVKTTEGTKNIEVVVKDIEAIKNGNGSLNIVTDNRVKINLPLSAIDKSLLEGAKDVTIKLDIIENSDIVKNIKGVNKVFDFNLIINKEDGTTNVHNFKEGLVEVKLNLTDKDLEGLNKDKIVVYYYNDSTKAFEEMETSVNGNEVTFKTPHFSKYVIAEKTETKNGETPANGGTNGSNTSTDKKTEAGKGQLPETGARVSNTTILVLAVGMLAIGGAMFFRKRKHA